MAAVRAYPKEKESFNPVYGIMNRYIQSQFFKSYKFQINKKQINSRDELVSYFSQRVGKLKMMQLDYDAWLLDNSSLTNKKMIRILEFNHYQIKAIIK